MGCQLPPFHDIFFGDQIPQFVFVLAPPVSWEFDADCLSAWNFIFGFLLAFRLGRLLPARMGIGLLRLATMGSRPKVFLAVTSLFSYPNGLALGSKLDLTMPSLNHGVAASDFTHVIDNETPLRAKSLHCIQEQFVLIDSPFRTVDWLVHPFSSYLIHKYKY